MIKLTDEMQEKIHIWAEGSKELEELLIACNSNNLKTFACCKGHEDRKIYDPYVGVFVTGNNQDLLSKLCFATLKEENSDILINVFLTTIRLSFHTKNFNKLTNIINLQTEKNKKNKKIKEDDENMFFADKVFKLLMNNLNFDTKLLYILKIENDNTIMLKFQCFEKEKDYDNVYKTHNQKLQKLPNIQLNYKEEIIKDTKFISIKHKLFFKDFKEMFKYIDKYKNEIFNY